MVFHRTQYQRMIRRLLNAYADAHAVLQLVAQIGQRAGGLPHSAALRRPALTRSLTLSTMGCIPSLQPVSKGDFRSVPTAVPNNSGNVRVGATVIIPKLDVGMAMDYLRLSPIAMLAAAIASLAAIAAAGGWLMLPLP
jgi:hypothetical protein